MNLNIPDGYILKNSCKPLHGFQYKHPFDGHGLINRIQIKDNKFTYRGIRVKTEQYEMEKKCNKMLFRGLNTNVKFNPFFIENFSNISVFHHEGEVQSISEGGAPYLIDIEKGETIGRKFKWVPPIIPYFPISAHPKVDDGKVVNFSGLINGFILFNDDGIILTEIFPNMGKYYLHDFAITDTNYVFYLNNIDVDVPKMYGGSGTILECFSFNSGNKVLIIDKKTKKVKYFEMPEYYDMNALHVAHVTEDEKHIHIYLAFIPENFEMSKIETAYDFNECFLHKITINKKTEEVNVSKLTKTPGEMPVVSDGNIFMINTHSVLKHDTKTDTTSTIEFNDQLLEEPVIVENLLFVIGHKKNQTILTVLDSHSSERLHREEFPFQIPYGFHGTFLPN